MSEANRSYSDSAESEDLQAVRRPHRSRKKAPQPSAETDQSHRRRRRHGDGDAAPKDHRASNESRSNLHRHRHRRRSSDAGNPDATNDKPREREHGEKVRRRSSVSSSTTRLRQDSTSERAKTIVSQQSGMHSRERSHRVIRSTPPSNPTDGGSLRERSKVGGKSDASQPRRSSSVSEKSTRPSLSRSSTSVHRSTKISPLPTVREEPKVQAQRPVQRSLSVFGNLFGPSVPEEKVSCLTCMDDFATSKAPLLTCGHRMCQSCLKRIFTLSVTDPAHMPPKCCTDECIPLKHVQKLFDDRFKIRWNKKYHEYTTKNRLYCPAKGCGSWIPPKDITRDKDGGRKYGTCRKCKTQVCAACNGKRHKSKECPKDDSTEQFAEMAKNNGWQRCYNCSAIVELKEGCNHMTCRCTAQFCMICGDKWKTCNCPWFNYAAGNGGFLNYMNVYEVREEVARGGEAFAQPRAYTEELERRREQEQQDEALARRMQDEDRGLGLPRAAGNAGIAAGWAWGWALPTRPARPFPYAAARFAPPTLVQPLEAPPDDVPPPIPSTPPEPVLRRSATVRSTRPAPYAPPEDDTDSTAEKTTETGKGRQAVLAGLNRVSHTDRVDAWRQYVSGEPDVRPL